jgi:hypothetical protein
MVVKLNWNIRFFLYYLEFRFWLSVTNFLISKLLWIIWRFVIDEKNPPQNSNSTVEPGKINSIWNVHGTFPMNWRLSFRFFSTWVFGRYRSLEFSFYWDGFSISAQDNAWIESDGSFYDQSIFNLLWKRQDLV